MTYSVDNDDLSEHAGWGDDPYYDHVLSEELPYTRTKRRDNVPVVTVFGGGVAGLSAAHELIQRGFTVQVVEPTPHPDFEYSCWLGGLAASQSARLNRTRRLHWALYSAPARAAYLASRPDVLQCPEELELKAYAEQLSEEDRESLLATVRALRERELQPVQKRHPLPFKLSMPIYTDQALGEKTDYATLVDDPKALFRLMKVPEPTKKSIAAWQQQARDFVGAIPDLHGEVQAKLGHFDPLYLNATKIEKAALGIVRAVIDYSRELNDALDALRMLHGEIFQFVDDRFRRREILLVEVRGYCNLHLVENRNAGMGLAWARFTKQWICDEITAAVDAFEACGAEVPTIGDPGQPPTLTEQLVDLLREARDEMEPGPFATLCGDLRCAEDFLESRGLSNNRTENERDYDHVIATNFVAFKTIEHVVLGEHGFRYFPGFYRHVFDLMKRTPLLDERMRDTGRTVLDQLVVPPTARLGLSGPGGEYRTINEGTAGSIEQMREEMQYATEELGFTYRDELRYSVQLLKFLTSSPERRRRYEDFSWWEFVDGKSEYDKPDPEGALHGPSGYSEKGTKLLRDLPQILVAMSADESDALTNGNISVQMLMETFQSGGAKDRMLNGPTSISWLAPWKRFLKKQGVRFFRGGLSHLSWDGDEPVPVVSGEGATGLPVPESPFDVYIEHGGEEPTPDFYVTALPYALETEIVWRIDGLEDKQLRFDAAVKAFRELAGDVSPDDPAWRQALARALVALQPAMWHWQLNELAASFVRQMEFWRRSGVRLHSLHYDTPMLPILPADEQARIREAMDGLEHFDGASVLDDLTSWEARVDDLAQQLESIHDHVYTRGTIMRALELLRAKLRFLRFQPASLLWTEKHVHPHMDLLVKLANGGKVSAKDAGSSLGALVALLAEGAVELESARHKSLSGLDGDLFSLQRFDIQASRRDANGDLRAGRAADPEPYNVPRQHSGRPQPRFDYPLRDLTGIQYYFRELVNVGHGRFVLPDSAWGITGVGQIYFWRRRPSRTHGYIGQMSVDVANFYEPYRPPRALKARTAWECTAKEIAVGVWDQIIASAGARYRGVVSRPRFFQIDSGLEFDGRHGVVRYNRNMLMINLPGQWAARPGIAFEEDGQRVVRYGVSNTRWVLAGTYMATTTRLTTMEAANESGRHAVNAILSALLHTRSPELYNGGGSFIGEFCEIWDPEDNEPLEFAPFKRLDAELYARNIPHFLDVLEVRKAVDEIPMREDPDSTPVYNLTEVVQLALEQLKNDWSFLPEATSSGALAIDAKTEELRRMTKHASQIVEMIMKTVRSQRGD